MQNNKRDRQVIVCLLIGLMCPCGCQRKPYHDIFQIDAKQAGVKAIRQFDVNRDGQLDSNELKHCPGLKAAFSRGTLASEETVTANAITNRIRKWQSTHLARLPVVCLVTLDGQPLKNAHVEFVPEAFFNSDRMIRTAKGKTG